jgi:hypothetical protein
MGNFLRLFRKKERVYIVPPARQASQERVQASMKVAKEGELHCRHAYTVLDCFFQLKDLQGGSNESCSSSESSNEEPFDKLIEYFRNLRVINDSNEEHCGNLLKLLNEHEHEYPKIKQLIDIIHKKLPKQQFGSSRVKKHVFHKKYNKKLKRIEYRDKKGRIFHRKLIGRKYKYVLI